MIKHQTKMFAIFLFGLVALLSACGDDQAEYVVYDKPESDETTEGTDGNLENQATGELQCPDKVLAVFSVTVAPALDSACTSCHVDGQHKMPFYSGQGERNRQALISWGALKADKLAEFISSNPPHGGGDQSASLPAVKIEQWLDAEKECSGT